MVPGSFSSKKMILEPFSPKESLMLFEKIQDDVKAAMKARDAHRVETLRFLLAEVKNVGINAGVEDRSAIADATVVSVLQKLSKQRREGIEQFKAGGRADLVAKEETELAILESYLPRQIDDAEVEAAVKAVIAEIGASSKKDLGKVMKAAMARLAGQADGKRVSAIAGKLLP
jgi:hypothetical protein